MQPVSANCGYLWGALMSSSCSTHLGSERLASISAAELTHDAVRYGPLYFSRHEEMQRAAVPTAVVLYWPCPHLAQA
jgi:hypothetical protein